MCCWHYNTQDHLIQVERHHYLIGNHSQTLYLKKENSATNIEKLSIKEKVFCNKESISKATFLILMKEENIFYIVKVRMKRKMLAFGL